MEGIPVKISEKYKPPRKIALPASIQNKLNTEIKFEKYDFHLEQFVLIQMAKLREQQAKSTENSTAESSPVTKFDENIAQSDILTPVPLKPHVQTSMISQQAAGGFNISDFENDTSSPFDSVELKTINDMEELAHVLGGNSVGTPEWSSPENGCTTQIWSSRNSPYQMQYQPRMTITKNNDNIVKPVETVDNETSIILQGLQKHIDERKAVPVVPAKKEEKYSSDQSLAAGVFNSEKIVEKKRETLPNIFPTLNGQSQTVARRIAEMGFPLSRTSRAVEMFGPNQGKVIEFVLEVQSLEERGYPDERAERALVISKFCKDEAIKLLDNIEQIMKLGFSEDEVIYALVKHGFDRDKALDSLIS